MLNNLSLKTLQLLFYLFPITFILGNSITNIFILLISVIGIFFYQNKLIEKNDKYLLILFSSFFSFILLSSYLNHFFFKENPDISKSIFYLRYFIFLIVLRTMIFKRDINLNYFLIFNLYIVLFVVSDILIQFTTGKNILGYEAQYASTYYRGFFTGFFKEELIAGGFILMFSTLGFFSVPLIFKNQSKDFSFLKGNLEDRGALKQIFESYKPKKVINLAAQAGVRFSIKNPASYVKSNLNGFFNILDNCKNHNVDHLVYASSSSVYGGNNDYPFTENKKIDKPLSFYAATKISNEMMAYSYSNIHNIPITGLRFFTVYGPWGRPDMAPMIFSKKIFLREPISIFNYGKMSRDFTFIEDIVEGTFLCALKAPNSNELINSKHKVPNKIFNIGFGKPIMLNYFIELLEDNLSIKAIKKFEPIQPGDVKKTFSNTNLLEEWIGYKPKISVEEGVRRFATWFLEYYS